MELTGGQRAADGSAPCLTFVAFVHMSAGRIGGHELALTTERALALRVVNAGRVACVCRAREAEVVASSMTCLAPLCSSGGAKFEQRYILDAKRGD